MSDTRNFFFLPCIFPLVLLCINKRFRLKSRRAHATIDKGHMHTTPHYTAHGCCLSVMRNSCCARSYKFVVLNKQAEYSACCSRQRRQKRSISCKDAQKEILSKQPTQPSITSSSVPDSMSSSIPRAIKLRAPASQSSNVGRATLGL